MPAPFLGNSPSGAPDPARNIEYLDAHDAAALLELIADLAASRHDLRGWRQELLSRLLRLLPATASAMVTVKVDAALHVLQVVSTFDAGFKTPANHQAFLAEINDAPFQDPLSKKSLQHLFAGTAPTFTACRRQLVEDETWYKSAIVDRYRRPANLDNCLMSMQRTQRGEQLVTVLCAFLPWDSATRFSGRDRIVLDTLHRGLAWMYRAEASVEKLTRATALTPRLRQTLHFLLAGDTERQVAGKMRISIHTVHDYVKVLYQHFGVSSRGELLAHWIQSGGSLPAPQVPSQ